MRCSHRGCATSSRRPSRLRPWHRLSLESLESRIALSATSVALQASLASAPRQALPAAEVSSATEVAESAVGPARLSGLRLILAESTLKPRQPAAVESSTSGLSSSKAPTVNATSASPSDGLGPTSKQCQKYSLLLCKVPIDDSVSPIHKCPGLDDEFCVPKRPLPPTTPVSSGGSSSAPELTGTPGNQRPLVGAKASAISKMLGTGP